MTRAGVKRLVFSSSATVYGDPHALPIREDFPIQTTNPYGASKAMVEQRADATSRRADPAWRVALLRYFNPVGAHASGLIGEDPAGIPNNLMPYVAQVAVGKLRAADDPRRRLPDPRRHRRARLHPRRRSRARPPRGARASRRRSTASEPVNLGTGRGSTRARGGRRVRGGVRHARAARGRPAPAGRHRECYADRAAAPRRSSAGARSTASNGCASTAGAGSRAIRTVTRAD